MLHFANTGKMGKKKVSNYFKKRLKISFEKYQEKYFRPIKLIPKILVFAPHALVVFQTRAAKKADKTHADKKHDIITEI